jgi:hypothetical protein
MIFCPITRKEEARLYILEKTIDTDLFYIV